MQPTENSASANAQAIREALAAAKRRCVRSPHIDWRREDPVTGEPTEPFTWFTKKRNPETDKWEFTTREMVGIRVHPYNKGHAYGVAGPDSREARRRRRQIATADFNMRVKL